MFISPVCYHRSVNFYFTDESEPSLVIIARSIFILPTSRNRHSSSFYDDEVLSSIILYTLKRFLSILFCVLRKNRFDAPQDELKGIMSSKRLNLSKLRLFLLGVVDFLRIQHGDCKQTHQRAHNERNCDTDGNACRVIGEREIGRHKQASRNKH